MRENKAQLHVLEAVVAVAIVFLALMFVYQQATAPSVSSTYPSSQLKSLCDDALFALWSTPTEDRSYGNCLLAKLVFTNDKEGFVENMSGLLPENVFYNVWIYDGVNRSLWYPKDEPLTPIGSVVVAHQLVSNSTQILVVEMEAWEV